MGTLVNKNAFMYGWEYGPFEFDSRAKNALIRLFPALMAQKNDWFNFKDWSFKCERSKEETARIVWFKELHIRHSFTLESTFYGREKTAEESDAVDLHMHIKDFKDIGGDLARWFINFLPIPKYQKKINFLYKKFLKIIHEEALKWWLPFNQERYLKRNYSKDVPQIENPVVLENGELGPSLEELEGIGQTLEDDIEEIISSSSEDADSKYFWESNQKEVFKNLQTLESPKSGTKIDVNEEKIDKSQIENMNTNQTESETFEEESYHEFDNVINLIQEYEHEKANNPSEKSFCDDSDSDDEEENIIVKKYTKFRSTKPIKKTVTKKSIVIKSPVKNNKNQSFKATNKAKLKQDSASKPNVSRIKKGSSLTKQKTGVYKDKIK